MPALGKLQLSNDDGTTLGFVALTATDGVAFTVEDGRIRDFRQIGLFPLHGQLEGDLPGFFGPIVTGEWPLRG